MLLLLLNARSTAAKVIAHAIAIAMAAEALRRLAAFLFLLMIP